MATDNEQLVLSISADVRQIQRQLKSLVGQTQRDTKAIEDAFSGIEQTASGAFQGIAANSNKSLSSAEQAAKKLGSAMKASSAQTSNMAAQLQDIGVQLAGGQSPFLIGVQQLSQMNLGVLGVRGTLSAVAGAASSIVSPINLAGLAIIAATGYAVQYFSEIVSGGGKSEKALKEEADLIDRVAQKWGDALPSLKRYVEEKNKLSEKADLAAATEAVAQQQYEPARELLKNIRTEIAALTTDLQQAGAEDADIYNLQKSLNTLFDGVKDGKASTEQLRQVQENLASIFRATGIPAADEMAKAIGRVTDELEKAIAAADSTKFEGALQDFFKRSPLNQLQPLVSGGGKFLNPDQLQTQRANEAQLDETRGSSAFKMIRGFEGFSANSYWDVNAYRVGFGSDTTTRANGMIERVTKDTVVTLDDAERDLSRRITDFQSGIQKAVGIDTWRSLSEAQQAALTSIAYNYGSLPDSIVKAINGGGGPEKVAAAIAALSSNPKRRRQEAESYLSGTGISMADAGLSRQKSPSDIFQGDLKQVQQRIDALNAQYAAQARLNPLVDDYGYAVEKARIQQQLLADAQRAGVAITPEIAAGIDSLAENYARASAASDQLRTSQQKAAQSAREFNEFGKELAGGFIDDLRRGVSVADALSNALNRVLDKVIDIGLQSIFSGAGGGAGGLLGGLIIPGILHSGGVAGSDGYGHGRAVSSSVFSGAKRYHSGGVAGLQPGEIPAILQRGEVVLPRGTKMAGPQSIHVTVGVSSDGNGNLMPFVESVSQGQVQKAAPKIISAASRNVVPTMAAYQNNKAGAEWR